MHDDDESDCRALPPLSCDAIGHDLVCAHAAKIIFLVRRSSCTTLYFLTSACDVHARVRKSERACLSDTACMSSGYVQYWQPV